MLKQEGTYLELVNTLHGIFKMSWGQMPPVTPCASATNSIMYVGTQLSTDALNRQAVEEATIWTEVNITNQTPSFQPPALVIAPR